MDHKDEFSKWLSSVQEALSMDGQGQIGDMSMNTEHGSCGCNEWDCEVCFPEDNMQQSHNEICPTCGTNLDHTSHDCVEPTSTSGSLQTEIPLFGELMAELEGSMFENLMMYGGRTSLDPKLDDLKSKAQDDSKNGIARHINAMMDQHGRRLLGYEISDYFDKNNTVCSYHDGREIYNKSINENQFHDLDSESWSDDEDGDNSPLTYGDENLKEYDDIDAAADEADQEAELNLLDQKPHNQKIMNILYMQDMGLSNATNRYSAMELFGMEDEDLNDVYQEVLGKMVGEDSTQLSPQSQNQQASQPAPSQTQSASIQSSPYQQQMQQNLQPQGQPTMENVDKDVGDWLNRLNEYDKLKQEFNNRYRVVEEAEDDGEKEETTTKDENPWRKLADDGKSKSHTGGEITKTAKGLVHKSSDKKEEVKEQADPEVLEWMNRFSKLGKM